MSFPVWRELKHEPLMAIHALVRLTMSFPVWRELKQGSIHHNREWLCSMSLQCPFPFEGNWNCSYCIRYCDSLIGLLQCPFPFEGNWNITCRFYRTFIRHIDLQCPFPFEGNWNRCLPTFFFSITLDTTYNVLSRLKGIETWSMDSWNASLFLTYNVLSRLKGIETNLCM